MHPDSYKQYKRSTGSPAAIAVRKRRTTRTHIPCGQSFNELMKELTK